MFPFLTAKWWKLFRLWMTTLILVFGFKSFWKADVFLMESGRVSLSCCQETKGVCLFFFFHDFLIKLLICTRKKHCAVFLNFFGAPRKIDCMMFLLIMCSGNIKLRADLLRSQCFYPPPKISSNTYLCPGKKWLRL